MKSKLTKIALRTSVIYWALAAIWILLSDQAVLKLSSDPETISKLSMYKGWAFVTFTAILVFISLKTQFFLWERESSRRKQAEDQLRYQALLLANVNDAVMGMNEKFEITTWNQAAERLYGWKASEVIGRPLHEVLPTTFLDKDLTLNDALIQLQENGHFEANVIQRRKDGTPVTVEARAGAVFADDGVITGYVAVNRDITERIQAQEAIQNLALFPGENPNPLVRVARDGTVLYANPATSRLTEWTLRVGQAAPAELQEVTKQALGSQKSLTSDFSQSGSVYSMHVAAINHADYVNIYFTDVTDRIRAEEALRSSQQKFSSAFKISPDALNINRLSDGLYLDVNEGFTKITGYAPEEVQNKTSIELSIWARKQDRDLLVKELREKGEVTDFEAEFMMKDGSVRTGLMSARIIDVNGEPCILSATRDITERKRTEQQIRLLASTLASTQDCISLTDMDDMIIYVNDSFLRTYGYTSAELLGKPITILSSPVTAPEIRDEILPATRIGGWSGELMNKRKDGTDFPIELWTSTVKDSEGRDVAMVGVARDITGRKRVEEEVRQSEMRYRQVFETNQAVKLIIRPEDGRIIEANHAAVQFYGYDSDTLKSMSIYDINTLARESVSNEMQLAHSLEKVLFNFKHRLASGEIRDVEVYSGPMHTREGTLLYSIIHDVTERHRAEAERKAILEQFKALIENMQSGVLVESVDRKITHVNITFCELFGISQPDLLLGVDCRAAAVSSSEMFRDPNGFIDRVDTLVANRRSVTDEILHLRDGRVFERDYVPVHLRDEIIGNMWLYRDITERRWAERTTQTLYTISQSVHSSGNLSQLYAKIHHALNDLLRANNFYIALINESNEAIDFPYSADEKTPDDLPIISLHDQQSLTVEVIKTQMPLLLHEKELEERYATGKNRVWGTAPKCWLGVPLVTGERVIGVMTIQDYERGDSYGAMEMALLGSVADQVALAIEQKRSEKALRESEERYRRVVNQVQEVIFQTDEKGFWTFLNPAWTAVTGFPVHETLGHHYLEFTYGADQKRTTEEFMLLIEQKNDYCRHEMRFLTKDGGHRWIEVHATLLTDSAGKSTGTSGTLTDITDRKAVQQALQQSEERLRMAIEGSDDILTMQGVDGRYLHYIGSKQYGIDPDAIIGKQPIDLYEPLTAAMIAERHSKVISTGQPIMQDDSILWRGEQMWFSTQMSAVRDSSGSIIGTVSISHNITKRKRAEEALRRNEELFRNVFNQQFQFMILLSPEGRVLAVNDQVLQIGNMQREEYIGQTFWKTSPWIGEAGWEQTWRTRLKQAEKSDRPVLTEDSYSAADGSIRYANFATSAVRKPDGKTSFFIVQATDITERRKAEIALRDSEHALRKSQEVGGIGSYVFDVPTGTWESSQMLDRIFGIDDAYRKDIEGWQSIIHPSNRKELADYLSNHVLRDRNQFDKEYRILRHVDSQERWVHGMGVLELNEQQQPVKMIGTIRDITERKLAEEEIMNSNIQLRQLSAHLESVREEERKHISREIHDELGQELTALKMEAVLLQRAATRCEQSDATRSIKEGTTSLMGITDRAINTVRRIASELRPDVLDKLGLVAALEWHAKEFEKRSRIPCTFTTTLNDEAIDESVATAIFRIFQEALTNVVRHSGASHVQSELTRRQHNLVLRIIDNGRGITEEEVLYSKSLGLLGMSERALMLGGKATIRGKKDEGTIVEVEIPMFVEN